MTVAILALQGAFAEHGQMLDRLGVENFEIRQKRDLGRSFDALILPGGESTVMGKLLRELDLFDELRERIEKGLPVFGTCAGLILLAKDVEQGTPCFATMNLCARRNAYGRQLGSFHTDGVFAGDEKVPMTFIRAPYISKAGEDVEILAEVDGHIVAARQGNQLVTAFHPELDSDMQVYKYFMAMIEK
ncbi:MAG: pyridoxal 5'-phosphate synthase glutaminase subunit PdxT [Hespellia sp.]|nr:pyridoxal 5'-phosphate synthase glutaminase subunit PdxT [Hespellia sp.]